MKGELATVSDNATPPQSVRPDEGPPATGKTPRHSRGRQIFYIVVLAVAVPLLYLFYAESMRFFVVFSGSMEPAIQAGDYLVTFSRREYQRGEIVALRDPLQKGGVIIKRIVGLGGDSVAVRGGAVFINGAYASEPYRPELIDYAMGPYPVPEGEVFVLGDNANWSVDSHDWEGVDPFPHAAKPGSLAEKDIIGRVRYLYMPFKRVQRVKHYPLTNVEGK